MEERRSLSLFVFVEAVPVHDYLGSIRVLDDRFQGRASGGEFIVFIPSHLEAQRYVSPKD